MSPRQKIFFTVACFGFIAYAFSTLGYPWFGGFFAGFDAALMIGTASSVNDGDL
jgi:hypothetical protein